MEYYYKPNLKKRILAMLVDFTMNMLVFIVYLKYFGETDSEGVTKLEGWRSLPLFVFGFCYFIGAETLWGATIGHKLFDLKVISLDRKDIRFSQALKRRLLDIIDLFFYGIPAFITIKNTDKHQRLGDLWAKTIVIDTKDPEQAGVIK